MEHPLKWQRHTLPGVTLVPFALIGLTPLFGMGRGGPYRYSHQNFKYHNISNKSENQNKSTLFKAYR